MKSEKTIPISNRAAANTKDLIMPKFTNPDKQDFIRSGIYISIYLIIISTSAFLLLPIFWYLWALILITGLLLLVNWHKEQTVYKCPHCEHIYEVSFLIDLTAPHGIDKNGAWLFLRCPSCQKKSKTIVLKKVNKI